jgi:hypothetical protein
MKIAFKSILVFTLMAVLTTIHTSCSEDDLPNNGEPIIKYIRVADPASADSLLVAGFQDNLIVIVGENLQDARQIWFNDQPGPLVSTFITSTTIFTVVPADIPNVITNKITIVFGNGKTLEHDFAVQISKPEVSSMQCEFVEAGAETTIRGNFFYEPVKVIFSGNVEGEVIAVEEQKITVKIPEGAQPGPITVTTNFGSTASSFHFRDTRNIILNYDNLTSSGSWRPGTIKSENGLDGNYLLLKGVLNANQRTEDYSGGGFVSQFWGQGNGRPEGNLFDGDPKDYVLKFEARVVDWYGSYLNICFAPWNLNNNGEYWGNVNARAIWGPWDSADESYKTTGWITVTIPLTEFKHEISQDGSGNIIYPEMEFDPSKTGSLSFWVVGSPKANASPVEINIDNVRIVSK